MDYTDETTCELTELEQAIICLAAAAWERSPRSVIELCVQELAEHDDIRALLYHVYENHDGAAAIIERLEELASNPAALRALSETIDA